MKLPEWLHLFREHPEKRLFSTSDILQLSGVKRDVLQVELARLVKKGTLERIARGWYVNPFHPPSPEETAMVLRRPSYLSMEYALSVDSILSQAARTLTLVTTKNPYTFSRGRGAFEYHQIARKLFWGFEDRGTFQIACPEKALLDLIYIRAVRTKEFDDEAILSLLDDMYLDELDKARLMAQAKRFGGGTLRFVQNMF